MFDALFHILSLFLKVFILSYCAFYLSYDVFVCKFSSTD
jgi:hypothetical protein